jgi:hypothetical protein
MPTDASAYAALGLEPGADAAAVEQAYRRLIKLHHPDREGGDAGRAAEINRAYRDLRGPVSQKRDLILVEDEPLGKNSSGNGWVRAAVVLLAALAVLLLVTGPVAAYMRQLLPNSQPALPRGQVRPAARAGTDAMDQPIHLAAIDEGVRQAAAMIGRKNQDALLSASRECHRILRLKPSVTQLDRCAAFDDAVVQLQNHDAMWDEGPFSQLSVTGRQWSAAAAISNDYLAIDSRLDRIRLQVELALAPTAQAN